MTAVWTIVGVVLGVGLGAVLIFTAITGIFLVRHSARPSTGNE